MPTLHLIDTDTTQACPAVLSAIRAGMAGPDNASDRLVVIGDRPFADQANAMDIERVDHVAMPMGQTWLGLYGLRKAVPSVQGDDHVRCWSIGAWHAAMKTLKPRELTLALAHTPSASVIDRLRRRLAGKPRRVRVVADNEALAKRLTGAGVVCEVEPMVLHSDSDVTMSDTQRSALRAGWGLAEGRDKAVLLLSDHPQLIDGLQAAEAALLGCTTLPQHLGEDVCVSLVMHPAQRHRQRGEALLSDQPVGVRIVQDARTDQPWRLAGACDAVLAPGDDAGGLSLRRVAESGVAVIASRTSPADALGKYFTNLSLAPSPMTRDLAHALHQAMV